MSDKVYWDLARMQADSVQPSILAIGDSWFWYPFPGGSLINQVGGMLNDDHHIYAVGNNGAEAYDYVHGKYAKTVRHTLNMFGDTLSAVFISGGGNDFAGISDLRPLLKQNCSAEETAPGCFRTGREPNTLPWLMAKTAESYTTLISQIRLHNPAATIILHNYDYAYPSGKGVFGDGSGWLLPALVNARVPELLRFSCTCHLIDEFTKMLQRVAAVNPHVLLIDSRRTLENNEWANEIHPTPAGFRRIAERHWKPVLDQLRMS
ncbi:SGNH/GDSL hydrolase family protein [uncultured Massilia sp.]|uniref:SGNH/GDSL hydrolase family protein n=1 Tax=uncultured Massilia sp. TaxID=169973 RepID=UPI00258DF7F2|nr:SGNH/GDSL hydrolase family protein [uncultured Massilia sp.]